MKIISLFFASLLVFLLCGCHDSQSSDAALRAKLTGTWDVRVIEPDGSSDSRGTFSVAADGSYRSEMVTTVSNELRAATAQGFVHIRDGFLIETTTNVVPHWVPEAKRGTLPPGGVTSRAKIIRLDEHELVLETNQFGSVLYTKVRQ